MRFDATKHSQTARDPAQDAKPVTPNNDADLPDGPCLGLLVTVTGNISLVTLQGTTIALPSVPAYTEIRIQTARVRSTGTTATVLALY